ncbi:hypothetical protein SNEBB_007140 [Seison nebaliae]|nr:hypothetical protein SNEBB_007140 [Seison nebaliae]
MTTVTYRQQYYGNNQNNYQNSLVEYYLRNSRQPILLFGSAQCSFCVKATAFLNSYSIPYEYIDVTQLDQSVLKYEFENMTGASTIPRIFINNYCIGGYDDLIRLAQQGFLRNFIPKTNQTTKQQSPANYVSRQSSTHRRPVNKQYRHSINIAQEKHQHQPNMYNKSTKPPIPTRPKSDGVVLRTMNQRPVNSEKNRRPISMPQTNHRSSRRWVY